jgi:hypothetical protein
MPTWVIGVVRYATIVIVLLLSYYSLKLLGSEGLNFLAEAMGIVVTAAILDGLLRIEEKLLWRFAVSHARGSLQDAAAPLVNARNRSVQSVWDSHSWFHLDDFSSPTQTELVDAILVEWFQADMLKAFLLKLQKVRTDYPSIILPDMIPHMATLRDMLEEADSQSLKDYHQLSEADQIKLANTIVALVRFCQTGRGIRSGPL